MADGISVKVYWEKAVRDLEVISRQTDRATMWGLRQTGRKVKQVARRGAPVYRGKRADVPKGRLKKSISSDKRLKRTGEGGYILRVAPRGFPAQAYAPKMESRTPFMAPARDSVSAQAPAIFAGAWTRAMRRR